MADIEKSAKTSLPPPEFEEGRQARRDGKSKKDNPYRSSWGLETLGMDQLWDDGWEYQKDYDGPRYYFDKCRRSKWDESTCGNCGGYCST